MQYMNDSETRVDSLFELRLGLIALELEARWIAMSNARDTPSEAANDIDSMALTFLRGGSAGPRDETTIHAEIKELNAHLSGELESSGIPDPFTRLSSIFGLDARERDMVMLCAAAQMEARFARFYSYFQGDITAAYPTMEFFRMYFGDVVLLQCGGQAPLFRARILRFADPSQSANALPNFLPIILDQHILRFLAGSPELDARTWPYLQVRRETSLLPSHPIAGESTPIAPLNKWRENFSRGDLMNVIILRAPDNQSRDLGQATARSLGSSLLTLDAKLPPREDLREIVFHCMREALLWDLPLLLPTAASGGPGENDDIPLIRLLYSHAGDFPITVVIPALEPVDHILPEHPNVEVVEITLHALSIRERKRIWDDAASVYHFAPDAPPPAELAQRFRFTEKQIHAAAKFARNHALLERGVMGPLNREDILRGCRSQCNQGLARLAEKVETKFGWGDLVLPAPQTRQLREAYGQVANMEEIFGDWGFETTMTAGRGLNMLFSGPSGTGKTMAASVIAAELGLDMYQVDLATVVSKYIGETEKNLARIFQEAESSHAILFFDEADAMFGKRGDVQSAQDRFANIEVGYLLQRMERYSGIIVLATNLSENIDDAFLRRLNFIIEFPLPGEKERLEIWKRSIPEKTRMATDVDLPFLARNLRISGANIKNIVLFAAFHAVRHAKEISMRDIVMGVRHEMQKESKPVLRADLGDYYDFLEQDD